METPYKLGVIGTGAMGGSLVRGFVAAGALRPDQIVLADADTVKRDALAAELGANVGSNEDAIAAAEATLIAVKPQVLAEALASLAASVRPGHLVISIAAGVPIARLQELLGGNARVIRVMPNVLCTVGAAASAYAPGAGVTSAQAEFAGKLLATVGTAQQVEEKLLDAVTGLSGSAPAYVALVIEALADGGVAAGLPRSVALPLAAQTVLGAGKWVLENGAPAALKDLVTSPGGTTIAGLRELEAGGLRSALIEAVVAATERSKELGR
jgi:pyrroline-5-carboxylate reductase